MRKRIRKILVTGGAGFIGSAFLGCLITENRREKDACKIVVLDKLTYAGDLRRLIRMKGYFKFIKADICNEDKVASIFKAQEPDTIVHFAAETHVDRSIRNVNPFIETNIKGTQVLLDVCRKINVNKFVFISTDEVYGDIRKGSFKEESALRPNSPYAASKAAADLLAQAYMRTYDLPVIIIRPSNNYGPWQYPEKLIPLAMLRLFKGERVPIYAKGMNVREWLFVDDCAAGIYSILKRGRIGQIYNLGSGAEYRNIEVIQLLLGILGMEGDKIEFVADRPGHDFRYSLNSSKVFKHTGWKPEVSLSNGLKTTVSWARLNKGWLTDKWEEINKLYK